VLANTLAIELIQSLSYTYVPEYEVFIPERRYFRKTNHANKVTHHIHVVEINSALWRKYLSFRDYLRLHTDVAQQYENLKRTLASQFTDSNVYAYAKTDFIKMIEQKIKNGS
jgi:GrpB-like predicted nucleotidyltransferase (UPF0157 family)